MTLRISLLTTTAVAIGAILVTAGVVLTRDATTPAGTLQPDLAALEAEARTPLDPEATGVIVVQNWQSGGMFALPVQGGDARMANPQPQPSGVSADNVWYAGTLCEETACSLVVGTLSGNWDPKDHKVALEADVQAGQWAPQSIRLAALDQQGNLYLIDPETRRPSLVDRNVTAYTWMADDTLLFATNDSPTARLWRLEGRGQFRQLAALEAPVQRFYPSPSRSHLFFTQDGAEGWRLLGFDAGAGVPHEIGVFGALDGQATAATAPHLAVAWSPDESRVAVGPVDEPYVMFVVSNADGAWQDYAFVEGYAGELAWSPDGSRLAISTYSSDRTRHEVYVLDIAAGEQPRHLLAGCRIVWSPDGKFIVMKQEPHSTGLGVIRVDSGVYWTLSGTPAFVPLAWGADEPAALDLATKPVPYAVQLGK